MTSDEFLELAEKHGDDLIASAFKEGVSIVRQRIAELEAELASIKRVSAAVAIVLRNEAEARARAEALLIREKSALADVTRERGEERARLRTAITSVFGGMGTGAPVWGWTQYDKGFSAALTAALTAFDAALDAAREDTK